MNRVIVFISIIGILLSVNTLRGQKFAVISDIHGATASTLSVSQLVQSWAPEFIITCGDNHYSSLSAIDEQVGPYYSSFIFPYTGAYGTGDTANRFYPCMGNHDLDTYGYNPYTQYFTLPGNEHYYDFVKGSVHFFALNSDYTEPDGVTELSNQALWLQAQLANSTAPFKVVYFHLPPYSSGMHGSTTYMRWPFKQWGASIVLSGHDHYYEKLLVDSLPYLICGVGGGALYTYYNPLAESLFYDCNHYGALLAQACPDSLILEFRNTSDSLIDKVILPNAPVTIRENDTKQLQLMLSPNPASQKTRVTFYVPSFGKTELKITDVNGRTIISLCKDIWVGGTYEEKLDVSFLNNGFYLCTLHFKGQTKTCKLLKY